MKLKLVIKASSHGSLLPDPDCAILELAETTLCELELAIETAAQVFKTNGWPALAVVGFDSPIPLLRDFADRDQRLVFHREAAPFVLTEDGLDGFDLEDSASVELDTLLITRGGELRWRGIGYGGSVVSTHSVAIPALLAALNGRPEIH